MANGNNAAPVAPANAGNPGAAPVQPPPQGGGNPVLRRVAQIEAGLQHIESRVDHLDQQVVPGLIDLARSSDEAFDAVDNLVNMVEAGCTALDALKTRQDALKLRVEHVTTRLDAIATPAKLARAGQVLGRYQQFLRNP